MHLMRRRQFLVATAVVLAAPFSLSAQRTGKVFQIGWLHPGKTEPRESFRVAMRELGYVEGGAIAFVTRLAFGQSARLPDLAAELVRAKVDVIVAVAPGAILAAKKATRSIPVVMAYWGGPDLVQSGAVASFARPGGNVTGVHMLNSALDPKRLELLVEAVPGSKLIAVLTHGGHRFEQQLSGVRDTARALGVQLRIVDVASFDNEFDKALQSIVQLGAAAVLVPSSPLFTDARRRIIESVAKARIPAIFEWGFTADEGGLMAYGPTQQEMDRQVARYVDKILKGSKAGELPIEQPTKFELVVNLKSARAQGITVPQSTLLRADRVIE